MARRNGFVSLGLAACAALAGCGETGAHATQEAAVQPRYVRQGNAICAAQLARLSKLTRPTTPEQSIAYLPAALAIMHHELTALRALHPPDRARTELAAALSSADRLAVMLTHMLRELRHGTVEFAQLAAVQTQSETLRAQLDARFRRAGLTSCSE